MTTTHTQRSTVLLLLGILILGVILRTVNIQNEAAWFDELVTLHYLEVGSLSEYLEGVRIKNPVHPPLYMIFQYAWALLFGPTVLAARILSLLAGTLSLIMIFVVGRQLYGTRAGLLAALWMSLNAFHIYHSQEVRFYAFVTLFALLSIYAFLKLLRTPAPKWWLLTAAIDLALVWIHPLTATLFAAQALYLAIFHRDQLKHSIAWLTQRILFCLSLIPWARTIDPTNRELSLSWLDRPEFFLPGPSLERFTRIAVGEMNRLPTNPLAEKLIAIKPALTGLLVITYLAAIFFVLKTLFTQSPPEKNPDNDSATLPFNRSTCLLSLWLIVPPAILFILSYLWRPTFQTRYLIHATLPIYIFLAAFLVLQTPRLTKYLTGALLIFSLTYYAIFHIPGPFRPRYDDAATLIRENYQQGERIAFHWVADEYALRHYLQDETIPTKHYPTRKEFIAEFSPDQAQERAGWYFISGPVVLTRAIEQLDAQQANYTTHNLSSGRQIVLIHIQHTPND